MPIVCGGKCAVNGEPNWERISDFINLSAESTELLATDPWTDDVAEELERSIECDLVNSLLYVSGP